MKNTTKTQLSIAFMVIAVGLFMISQDRASAASYCSTTRSGVYVRFEGRFVTLTNNSGECKQVGVAVYATTATGSREADYYSARSMDLQSGKSYTIPALIPPCYHVIMAFTGEALRNASSSSAYGDRFIEERAFTDASYCPYGYRTTSGSGYVQTGTHATTPSPTYYPPGQIANYPPYNTAPAATSVPLPKNGPAQTPYNPGEISYVYPDPSPVPLPNGSDGSVLGAATSSPLNVKTGAATLPLVFLSACAVASGTLRFLGRRKQRLSLMRY